MMGKFDLILQWANRIQMLIQNKLGGKSVHWWFKEWISTIFKFSWGVLPSWQLISFPEKQSKIILSHNRKNHFEFKLSLFITVSVFFFYLKLCTSPQLHVHVAICRLLLIMPCLLICSWQECCCFGLLIQSLIINVDTK